MARAHELDRLLERLFPICRSITGNGVRETLGILQEHIPLTIHEVPTGTQAFDWTVPKEWNITDAYIKGPDGIRRAEFRKHNLHVVGYSTPVRATVPLAELRKHLHSLPEQPDLIPHRTSYYSEDWGFCLPHRELLSLPEGKYEVVIDSTLTDGSLTYGEYYLPGETQDEVLLSAYVCHPSMANDNLSGVVLLTFLAQELAKEKRRFSYRFVFAPETIGALVWLSRNQDAAARIRHGLVATCAGNNGAFTYKKSRLGDAEIDRTVQNVLKESGVPYSTVDFFPMGSDERQYCSPGFDLPVGSLMRTMYHKFPEYHTSADDLSLVTGAHIEKTLCMYETVLRSLERTPTYRRTSPWGEPQLGRRGLYAQLGGPTNTDATRKAMLWVLNYSDGRHSLADISDRAQLPLTVVTEAADALVAAKLIEC